MAGVVELQQCATSNIQLTLLTQNIVTPTSMWLLLLTRRLPREVVQAVPEVGAVLSSLPAVHHPTIMAWLTSSEDVLRPGIAPNEPPLSAQETAAILASTQRTRMLGQEQTDPCYKPLVSLLRYYSSYQKMLQQQQQQHLQQQQQSHMMQPMQPMDGQLTNDQVQALRQQMQAYRYLSRNMPLPPEMQQAVMNATAQAVDSKDARTKLMEATAARLNQQKPIRSDNVPYQPVDAVVQVPAGKDPQTYLKHAALNVSLHRVLVPSMMPQGLDPIALAQERERQIRHRIAARIAELESMLTVAAKEPGSFEPERKIKILLELKSLRLLDKQRHMRQDVIKSMKRASTLQTAAARSEFRRVKKSSLREVRLTEKLEKQQRMDRERKEKQKQLDYLNGVVQHGRDMLAARKALALKQLKLGKAIVSWHSNTEREEQKRIERTTKERIRALKEDNEEAYLKLIDQQKDTRITHLLKQTDKYLEDLTSLVQAQQEDIASRDPASFGQPPVPADGSAAALPVGVLPTEEGDEVDYFAIAHRIREKVVQQPSILIGGSLKEYQLAGLEWMVSLYNNKLNGILADEMGLGKTIQTLSLITYLIEKKNQTGPFLIIVPLSTITNWTLEFEKWAPSVVKVVYKGTPQQRRNIQVNELRRGFNVLLTTFEYIIKDKAVLAKYKWVHTIIDEGHRMKNANSKLSQTLTQFYSSRYRLILTGTPLQNNLPELWALLNFVLPKVFGSMKTFDEWFNTPFANTGEKLELNEEEQLLIIRRLHKVLRPFLLRRLKKDVESDLPDKTERVLKTPLSSLQQKIYNQIRMSGAVAINSSTDDGKKKLSIRGINNTIMQLRKICNHPYTFSEVEDEINPDSITDENIMRVSGKFELLNRILPKFKASGHRVLIFFQMTAVMTIMEDFLQWKGYKYMRLDGSTKAEDRTDMLKEFNAPDSEYFVFILSTRAGGLGLNLQSADTVIIFDSDWNPHQDLQAQDRAHRIGQTKEVRIFRLITANSVEENILARAQQKLDIDGKVIQAGKFDNKSTNEEREAFLRSLLTVESEENGDDQNDAEDDEYLNEVLARTDEELVLFRQIDAEMEQEYQEHWRSKGHSGKYPRLITLNELPEIYLHDSVPMQTEKAEDFGRGQRSKGDVRYDDGLTDDQWAEAIDKDIDVDKLVEKRRQRRQKRLEKKSQEEEDVAPKRGKRARVAVEDDTEDDDDEDSGESDTQARKKTARTVESEDESEGRRKKVKMETSGSSGPTRLQQLLFACLAEAKRLTASDDDGNVRNCADLFLTLPSKKEYPDYYQIISSPIALDGIEEKIQNGVYSNVDAFRRDIVKMVSNATTYNEDGSFVIDDAKAIQAVIEAVLAKEASMEVDA